MDPDSMLSSRLEPRAHDIANGFLFRILKRFKMARSWLCELAEWQRYYRREKKKYRDCGGSVSDSPKSNNSDGVGGGGLKDYAQLFERMHKQFGKTVDDYSNWSTRDIDLADTRLSHDDDSAEQTSPRRSAAVKPEKEGTFDNTPNQQDTVTNAFTPVNQHEIRTPPTTQAPAYGPQTNTYVYHPDSTPQYRGHPSQPTATYPYVSNSVPQTNMSTARGGFEPGPNHFTHAPPIPIEATYAGWPLPGSANMNAARAAIEAGGAQTFNNSTAFGTLMLGDAALYDTTSNWTMGVEPSTYDSNNTNTAFYPPSGSVPTYQYQQS